MLIKWNPAIKTRQEGLLKALLDDRIDIIHGPRTTYFGGKGKPYFQSMSGPDGSALSQCMIL
jgi:hypothetical protein